MAHHFGLTFLVQGKWYKSYVNGTLIEPTIDNEVELAILNITTLNLCAYMITKEYSRKGNVPHYHVYICADEIDVNSMNEIYPYGYIWYNELKNTAHYINYICKYFVTEKIVRIKFPDPDNDPHDLYSIFKKCINGGVKKTKSVIERFLGKTMEEYINEMEF